MANTLMDIPVKVAPGDYELRPPTVFRTWDIMSDNSLVLGPNGVYDPVNGTRSVFSPFYLHGRQGSTSATGTLTRSINGIIICSSLRQVHKVYD